ncbi:alpha/beta fold hydrolase [Pseudoruegeria sp. HB172150]|uniref:alpha/beta fold hydrolase n=1 Tax=Pseudoruegeria sp. HB172150 TaxID=2721164 RepID=UPI001C12E523|nr:alpha/beta fold hydrolase [Pseudoruegeria sp. HB172150]
MLGPFEVVAGGVPVAMPPSRKTRALLAYLVLSPRAQRRERLCEMFWDIPDDPKGALRWSLSKIRRIVGDAEAPRLKSDRAAVDFDAEGLDVDAANVFGLRDSDLADLATEVLEEIALSYRGAFLEDLQLDRCPEFEAWRTAMSFEAETTRVRVLKHLIDRLAGDPARALPHAEALAALTPDDGAATELVGSLRDAVRNAMTARTARPVEPAAQVAEPPSVETLEHESTDIRFVTARDGTRIAWTEIGEGPVLVRAGHWMTHLGRDFSSSVWGPWVRELSRDARYVRYDARCNGMSDRDPEDLSLDTVVGDLEAVVDAAGIDRFTLFGPSQGSTVAIEYALRHPDRLNGLILYGGYAKGWRARGDAEEIARREALLVLMDQGWGSKNSMFRDLFSALFMPDAPREIVEEFGEMQRSTLSPRNAVRTQRVFAEVDLSDRLADIRVPTLVMHSTGDQLASIDVGRALARGIPGARFVELQSNNHLLLEHEPAFHICNDEIRGFLRKAPQSPEPEASAWRGTGSNRVQCTILDVEMLSPLLMLDGPGSEAAAEEQTLLAEGIAEIADRNGGTLLSSGQGRAVVAFGIASPSEVHAVQACRAALEIREMVEERSDGAVRVRQGIDAGPLVVRESAAGLDATGVVIRRARQITEALRSSRVALSDEATYEAGAYCSFSAIRSVDLAGSRGRRIFELKEIRSAPSRWHLRLERRLSAFVGRELETAALDRAQADARAGRGKAVFISGEPGVGKSRLTQEYLAKCRHAGLSTVEAGALELDDNTPMSLLARVFEVLLQVDIAADSEEVGYAVRTALAAYGLDDLLAPVLFAMDLPCEDLIFESLSTIQRQHRVRDALRRLIAIKTARTPLVILIEDLHWADDVSLAALEGLIQGVARLLLLLIMTARPSFRPPWLIRGGVLPLPLDPLTENATAEFVRNLVGPHSSLGVLRRLLRTRTDGMPLMIEETVSALVQDGRIAGAPGAYVARAPIIEIEPKASVMPVIAARIAQLDETPRRVLQIAAAIGREGPLAILRRVAGLAPEVFSQTLQELERSEFLFELIGGSGAYVFKHALISEVAYGSLTDEDRKALHRDLFAAFRDAGGPGNTEPLAHHAYQGGLWAEAVDWLIAAAARAVERSAYDRAVACLERADSALAALPPDPENTLKAIDIRLAMQPAYASLGNFDSATMRIAEACDLAEEAGESDRLAQALLKMAYTAGTCGQLEDGIAAAARLAEHASKQDLDFYACEADLAAAFALTMKGDARAAMRHLARHRSRFTGDLRHERFKMVNTRSVWLNGNLAHVAALLGELDLARECIAISRAVARETGRPQDNHCSLQFALQVAIAEGVTDHALAEVQLVLAESLDEYLFPAGPWLLTSLGDALLQMGRREAAESVLERAYEAAHVGNMRGIALLAGRLLACAQARGGNVEARDELMELADKEMPIWLKVRILSALAATEDDDVTAVGFLATAADISRDAGYRPDLARCLDAQALRLKKSDAEKASQLSGEAERLRKDMGARLAAHA